jgi:folate-dependent phosphoribosylglycinamide formyltransferase PurN
MEELINEKPLNEILMADDSERKIIPVQGTRWGELIVPAKHENPGKSKHGLRVLAVASFYYGYQMFETLKACEKKFPDRLNLVGLVTDDPANPDAKISAKKRIWRLFDQEEKLDQERAVLESALGFGLPCYTGEVKTEYFMKLLNYWKPEAIIVFVFGQIFNSAIINFPGYGIYNFHPTDLANHYGAGPQPFEDLIARKANTSKLTIHHITEEVDSGSIVGQSPPVNIKLKNGSHTDNPLLIEDKMTEPIDHMAAKLISELILKKESGKPGKIDTIDFDSFFSDEFKLKLMQPIQSTEYQKRLPELSKGLEFFA